MCTFIWICAACASVFFIYYTCIRLSCAYIWICLSCAFFYICTCICISCACTCICISCACICITAFVPLLPAFPQCCTVHASLIVFKQSLIIKQWSMLKLDAKLPYSCNESTHPAATSLPENIKTHFRINFSDFFPFFQQKRQWSSKLLNFDIPLCK